MDKKKKKFNYNILSCIFIYAVTLVFLISSFTIKDSMSRAFPIGLCILSLLLCTVFLINILRHNKKYDGEDINMAGTGMALVMAVMILLYIIAIYFAGYYIATAIYMPIAMYYLGQRKWLTILLVTAAFVVAIYLFFGLVLDMQMPEAYLFK